MMIFIENVFLTFHPQPSQEEIAMKLNEVAGVVSGLVSQVEKVKTEVLARIDELSAALQDVTLPAEAEAALESLRAGIQGLDDLNPDAVVEPDPVV